MLIKSLAMRWLPLLLLVACDWTEPDRGLPDASAINCHLGYDVTAPQPGLHYATNLDVIADMGAYYADSQPGPGAAIADSVGNHFDPLTSPVRTALNDGRVEFRWQFQLSPNTTYELYTWSFECDRYVDFFTTSQ